MLTDDDIVAMLGDTDDEVDLDDHVETPGDGTGTRDGTILATESPTPLPAIRLVKLDGAGAAFEFPGTFLRETAFRTAMPRTCMRCGARAHLQPHVIPFVSPMMDVQTVRALQSSGVLICCEPGIDRFDTETMLERLPKVPNMPEPAELPMPYWMCDMCNVEGLVDGRLIEDARTGQMRCRLRIANVHRARDFFKAAGGPAEDLAHLVKRCNADKEKPWDLVPLTVRQRLQQWFHPEDDEHFLGYIPERSFAHTEDGRAGLVLSDKRLIYHSHTRHRESKQDQPLTLLLAIAHNRGELQIKTSNWQVKKITLDREGIRRLRRALTLGHFKTEWR